MEQLNGHYLTDPAEALQAFALLRSDARFSLAIVRKDVPQSLYYQVD